MDNTRKNLPRLLAVAALAVIPAAVAIWWFSPDQHRKRQADVLGVAATNGDVRGVDAALAAGADVNSRDSFGVTPLMLAARGRQPDITNPAATDRPEVVELLIKHGAQPNATTATGFVALFWAARYGHYKVAKVLVDAGADVNARDRDGQTALKWANTNHQSKVTALLRAAGAR
jgi:ankyrin repeat protein